MVSTRVKGKPLLYIVYFCTCGHLDSSRWIVTFILSKGGFSAVVVSCVDKFTIRGKRRCFPVKEKCKNCLAEKILSLSSRNCVYPLCFFPDQTVICEKSNSGKSAFFV